MFSQQLTIYLYLGDHGKWYKIQYHLSLIFCTTFTWCSKQVVSYCKNTHCFYSNKSYV